MGSLTIVKSLWHVLDVTPAGELLYAGVDGKGEITEQPGAQVAAETIGRRLAREREVERKDT